jgi:hypothetical protein
MNRFQSASYYIIHIPYGAESFSDSYTKPAIEGYMYAEDDTFYIVFRASSTPMDYVVNFQFPKVRLEPHTPYKAHGGYVRHYTRIHDMLLSKYIESQCSKLKIIGYSMGASVALISAYYFNKIAFPKVTIFEPLAVCNRDLQIYLEAHCDIHYTTYGNDIVTKLLFWNYHVGWCQHFGGKRVWWKLSIQDHPFNNILHILH